MTDILKKVITTLLFFESGCFGYVTATNFDYNTKSDYELISQRNDDFHVYLPISEYSQRPTWHESEIEVYNQILALVEYDKHIIAVERQVSFYKGKVCQPNTKGCVRADIVIYFDNRPPIIIEVKNYSKKNYSLYSVLKNQNKNYMKHLPPGAEVMSAVDFTGQNPTPERVIKTQNKIEQTCFVLGCI